MVPHYDSYTTVAELWCVFVYMVQVVHRVGVFDTTDDASDDDMAAAAGMKNIRYAQQPALAMPLY